MGKWGHFSGGPGGHFYFVAVAVAAAAGPHPRTTALMLDSSDVDQQVTLYRIDSVESCRGGRGRFSYC